MTAVRAVRAVTAAVPNGLVLRLGRRLRRYLRRPNLPDEADNHVVELAVAGNAEAIVTHNTRDFRRNELRFPGLAVVTPRALIAES